MKKLLVCDTLFDDKQELITWQYCAPVFISNTFSGTLFSKEKDLLFKEFDSDSVRNGTLTFLSYKGELFAITCKHVVHALNNKQVAWKMNSEKNINTNRLLMDINYLHLLTTVSITLITS